MAEPGRTQALPGEQIFGDSGAGDAAIVFENQSCLFEGAFLAGHFKVEQDVLLK
jgi:hypothetical protein